MGQRGNPSWKKGMSGNPAGRPKGSRNKYDDYRDMIRSNMPKLMNKCLKMALDGDTMAMKILMERVLPALKSVEVTVESSTYETLIERLRSQEVGEGHTYTSNQICYDAIENGKDTKGK